MANYDSLRLLPNQTFLAAYPTQPSMILNSANNTASILTGGFQNYSNYYYQIVSHQMQVQNNKSQNPLSSHYYNNPHQQYSQYAANYTSTYNQIAYNTPKAPATNLNNNNNNNSIQKANNYRENLDKQSVYQQYPVYQYQFMDSQNNTNNNGSINNDNYVRQSHHQHFDVRNNQSHKLEILNHQQKIKKIPQHSTNQINHSVSNSYLPSVPINSNNFPLSKTNTNILKTHNSININSFIDTNSANKNDKVVENYLNPTKHSAANTFNKNTDNSVLKKELKSEKLADNSSYYSELDPTADESYEKSIQPLFLQNNKKKQDNINVSEDNEDYQSENETIDNNTTIQNQSTTFFEDNNNYNTSFEKTLLEHAAEYYGELNKSFNNQEMTNDTSTSSYALNSSNDEETRQINEQTQHKYYDNAVLNKKPIIMTNKSQNTSQDYSQILIDEEDKKNNFMIEKGNYHNVNQEFKENDKDENSSTKTIRYTNKSQNTSQDYSQETNDIFMNNSLSFSSEQPSGISENILTNTFNNIRYNDEENIEEEDENDAEVSRTNFSSSMHLKNDDKNSNGGFQSVFSSEFQRGIKNHSSQINEETIYNNYDEEIENLSYESDTTENMTNGEVIEDDYRHQNLAGIFPTNLSSIIDETQLEHEIQAIIKQSLLMNKRSGGISYSLSSSESEERDEQETESIMDKPKFLRPKIVIATTPESPIISPSQISTIIPFTKNNYLVNNQQQSNSNTLNVPASEDLNPGIYKLSDLIFR